MDDLLARLPESANTIAVINVKAVREQTPSDERQGSGFEIVAGMIIPPPVDVIVYATNLTTGELNSRNTTGVIRLNRDATLDEVVDRVRGSVISLGGTSVVTHPTRGYFAMIAPNLLAFARQVSRQEFARWFQYARTNRKVQLSKYLSEAVAAADAPVFGALDMEEQLDAKRVHERLLASSTMKGHSKEEIDALAALVTGMRGITLTVRGRALNEAEVRFDFSAPVGDRADLIKLLFTEALDDIGTSLREFRNGKAVADGATVKLTTRLSGDGLIQIMSIFTPPLPSPKPAAEPKLEANGVSLQATQRFFNSVNRIIDDVRQRTRSLVTDDLATTIRNYNNAATRFETAAKQIESVSTRYVDSDMVKFGDTQAAKLRALAMSMRGVVIDVNALESGTTVFWTGGWWWGGGAIDTNIPAIRQKQAETVANDANRRLEIMAWMDSDRTQILRLMNERYKTDLSKPIR
jgi:hypothetical protein